MERALLQDAPDFVAVRVEEPLKPEWTRFAEQVDEVVRLLDVKRTCQPAMLRGSVLVPHCMHAPAPVEYLQLIHTRRLMIRFDDSEERHDVEIDKVTAEISSLFQRADRALKQITRPFVGGEASVSPADRLVRLNTQRAAASRLQKLSSKFRSRQRDYMQRLQLQKFGSDMFDLDRSGVGPTKALAQEQSGVPVWEIQARDVEIQRIAKSVGALAAIFKEVAEMVIDQGTLVDRIDYNMEQTASRMRSGLDQLRRAEQFQRNTRPERCIFLLVAGILLCFVLLVIKHS